MQLQKFNSLKEHIVKTAADLFINLGFKSVTMDDIAQKMGISKKTIYANFANKNLLVEETTYFILDKISEGIEEIRRKNLNAVIELFEIKRFTMQHLKNENSSPQFQLEKYYPQIYSVVKKHHLEKMEVCVINNLKRGINSGFYRPELPLDFITKMYFVGIMGMKDPEYFSTENLGMDHLYERFLEYYLRAVVTPQGLVILKEYLNIDE